MNSRSSRPSQHPSHAPASPDATTQLTTQTGEARGLSVGLHADEVTAQQSSGIAGSEAKGQRTVETALQACHAIVAFHESVFVTGRPLTIDGQLVDHTLLNIAQQRAELAIKLAEAGR